MVLPATGAAGNQAMIPKKAACEAVFLWLDKMYVNYLLNVLNELQLRIMSTEISAGQERMPFVFNALSDTGRFRIFNLLLNQEGLCVTEVANVLGVSVPAASQQLRIMELAGLLKKDRDGQRMCFRVRKEDNFIKSIIKLINN